MDVAFRHTRCNKHRIKIYYSGATSARHKVIAYFRVRLFDNAVEGGAYIDFL